MIRVKPERDEPRPKTLDAAPARRRFAVQPQRIESDELLRRALCESMARHGYDDAEVAEKCGVYRQQVERWRSTRSTELPNGSHIIHMPEPLRTDMLRVITAAAGMDCVPVVASEADALAALVEIERESSQAKLVTLRAVADGSESDAELAEQVREHTEGGDAHYRQAARCRRELQRRRAGR